MIVSELIILIIAYGMAVFVFIAACYEYKEGGAEWVLTMICAAILFISAIVAHLAFTIGLDTSAIENWFNSEV